MTRDDAIDELEMFLIGMLEVDIRNVESNGYVSMALCGPATDKLFNFIENNLGMTRKFDQGT